MANGSRYAKGHGDGDQGVVESLLVLGGAGGIALGGIAPRGENGVLQISASSMMRLRWNPYYPFMEGKILEFLQMADTGSR